MGVFTLIWEKHTYIHTYIKYYLYTWWGWHFSFYGCIYMCVYKCVCVCVYVCEIIFLGKCSAMQVFKTIHTPAGYNNDNDNNWNKYSTFAAENVSNYDVIMFLLLEGGGGVIPLHLEGRGLFLLTFLSISPSSPNTFSLPYTPFPYLLFPSLPIIYLI